jgi:hypothetical protein
MQKRPIYQGPYKRDLDPGNKLIFGGTYKRDLGRRNSWAVQISVGALLTSWTAKLRDHLAKFREVISVAALAAPEKPAESATFPPLQAKMWYNQ